MHDENVYDAMLFINECVNVFRLLLFLGHLGREVAHPLFELACFHGFPASGIKTTT